MLEIKLNLDEILRGSRIIIQFNMPVSRCLPFGIEWNKRNDTRSIDTERRRGGRKTRRLTGDNLARMDSFAHEPLYAPARSQFQRKLNLRTKFLSFPFPP